MNKGNSGVKITADDIFDESKSYSAVSRLLSYTIKWWDDPINISTKKYTKFLHKPSSVAYQLSSSLVIFIPLFY